MLQVLAVDDDPDALRDLTGVLGSEHQVTACGCSAEAERCVRLGRDPPG